MTAKQQRRVNRRICKRRGHLPVIDGEFVVCSRCDEWLVSETSKGPR